MDHARGKKTQPNENSHSDVISLSAEESVNPSKNKRGLIMEAGIQVFSKKGYHNAKMEDIAVAAGIGKGTIYEYFSSKLQLFQEIMETSFQLYSDSISTEKTSLMSLETRIRLITENHFRFCQQNAELSRIIFWEEEIFDEELKEWFYAKRKEKEGVLETLVKEGIERGELRDVDARLATLLIGGMLGQIWVPVVLEGWKVDGAAAAKQITDLIMHGIINRRNDNPT